MDLSQLSTDDLLAIKAGDLSKVSTDGLMKLRTAPATAQPQPAPQPTSELLRFGSTTPGRLIQGGIVSPVIGGAQAIVNAVPAVADFFGAKDYAADVRRKASQMNEGVKQYFAEYERDRAGPATTSDLVTGKPRDPGFDWAQTVGALLSPANRIVPFSGRLSTAGIAGRAAAQGGISGAIMPVTEGDNYASDKAMQIGGGAAIGGVAAPLANAAIQGVANQVQKVATRFGSVDMAAVDAAIAKVAQEGGFDLSEIPAPILAQVRKQAAEALAQGKKLEPAAALRKAEGDAVLGADAGLMQGQATRNPQQFARERDLRGVAGAGEPIATRLAAQNRGLINALNTRGAAGAQGEFQAGTQSINALRKADNAERAQITALYDNARALNAGEIPLAPSATQEAVAGLDANMKGAFLPSNIRDTLNKITSGDIPFNISTAEQFKSILGNEIAKAQRAGDGNVVQALQTVRQAMDNAQPMNELGAEAGNAFNAARAAAKARFQKLEANPALAAAVDDVAPDTFFQKFMLKGSARDVKQLSQTLDPETSQLVRAQIADHLKAKALNGATDEVGNFSQSAYNKALQSIGEQRLSAFFTAEEIASLKQVGRVASYIQSQPAGSAVNNSNTAAAAMNLLTGLSGRVPGGGVIAVPLNMLANGAKRYGQDKAVANALGGELPAETVPANINALRPYLLPFASAGGTLGGQLGQ